MFRHLLSCLAALPFALAAPQSVSAAEPAPVSALIAKVDIPYQHFALDNGLTVIVHTDRKAPVVAISVWYDVGSKNEPKGKTGFAHLFEHLMFNGSENAPGDFFEPLQQVGATDFNGTTWFDRTNYFETVPTSALDVALFLESDRMGHLLGGLDQEKLDNQRGVVQNEKRQGDNQPYGLVEYAQLENLFPAGHPYAHSTIGSMTDLDAASLDDVRGWFRDHYAPNNAIIVLAGDIDATTAREKVAKWFGDIPSGKKVQPITVAIPTLATPTSIVMKDRVATTRLYRNWAVPGMTDKDAVALDVGANVLGGLASSRLDTILVRQEKLAVSVTAQLQEFAQMSIFEVTADVRPGVDPDQVASRLDQIIADFIAKGPTTDEVKRVATTQVSGRISGLEQVGGFGGKAVALAEGQLYAGDPDFYKKRLTAVASVTPAQVTAAMGHWLTRPVLALRVEPGDRDAYQESGQESASRTGVIAAPAHYVDPDAPITGAAVTGGPRTAVDRSKLPDVGPTPNIDFPPVETTTLSNGIKVHFARRTTIPALRLSLVFDAGNAADPKDRLGTQALTLAMLEEGTTTRKALAIAEEQERLGASISTGASMDRSTVGLYALIPNLAPSLDLMADIVKNPSFDPVELERVRAQQLTRIAQEKTQPMAVALRSLPPLIYGAGHPYGVPFTGTGDAEAVERLAAADLAAFHRKWLRPDNVEIFAVGDITLAELKPMLEARFAAWRSTRDLPGRKRWPATTPPAQERIILIDRPQSPQSQILGGQVLTAKGTDELLPLIAANDVLGGNFLSRINMDLRETKGWSYGARTLLNRVQERMPFIVSAPVQADKTGPALAAIKADMTAFLNSQGVTAAELERTVNGGIRELPGSYETSGDILGEMQRSALYNRPFDYVESLEKRYRALDAPTLETAMRQAVNPAAFTWVVVGDKAQIMDQLTPLGIPITVMDADRAPVP